MTAHPKNHLREGIELFNRERFFECHEVLEEAWLITVRRPASPAMPKGVGDRPVGILLPRN